VELHCQAPGLDRRVTEGETPRLGRVGAEDEHAAQVALVREGAGRDELPRRQQPRDVGEMRGVDVLARGRDFLRPLGAALEEA
jgi:hypothetical protein